MSRDSIDGVVDRGQRSGAGLRCATVKPQSRLSVYGQLGMHDETLLGHRDTRYHTCPFHPGAW